MKNYKNLLTSLAVAIFVVASGFLASCEGPDGPAGPKGDTGTNGMDASSKCVACHSDNNAKINLAFSQFDFSLHGSGETYKYTAGRIGCASCHNGDGFAEAVALGQNDAVTMASADLGCKTCHVIHKNYDSTDLKLRYDAPVKLLYAGGTDFTADFKTGNICAKCHQARPYTRNASGFDTLTAGVPGGTFSRFGPHYGTPVNVIAMKGLNLIEGPEAYPAGNPHAAFSSNCVTCHMGKNAANPVAGGHTFKMTVAQMSTIESCKGCHTAGIPTTKATEIKALIAEYRQLLIDKGLLDISQANGEHGYNVLGEYAALSAPGVKTAVAKADMDVLLNYLYIAKDRSLGAHNPSFVLAIAKNGVAYLKQ